MVSLGIQDMDDFSLLADDGLDVGTYNTSVSDSNDLYNTPGGASITFGTTTLLLGIYQDLVSWAPTGWIEGLSLRRLMGVLSGYLSTGYRLFKLSGIGKHFLTATLRSP